MRVLAALRAHPGATIIAPVLRIWPLVALYAGVVIVFALAHMDREPYDDAHFFKRIAVHALEHGALAWNLDEGPVYGSTSQSFQALAVAVAGVARDFYMLAMRMLAIACSIAAFALLLQLTRGLERGVAVTLGFASPVVLYPLLSGMETSLAFLVIAGVLWLVLSDRGRRASPVALPLALIALYLTRPDAVLLVLVAIAIERWLPDRKRALREGGLFALLLGGSLLALERYYGTALPLPFYAKQAALSPYDPHFIAVSNGVRTVRFGLFLAFGAPLFFLALRQRDRTNLALLGAVLAFCGYHYFTTIEVMGMQGRFYAPAVPLLVIAAARGLSVAPLHAWRTAAGLLLAAALPFVLLAIVGALPKTTGWHLERVGWVFYAVIAPALVLATGAVAVSALRERLAAALLVVSLAAHAPGLSERSTHIYGDEHYLILQDRRHTVYRGLETLRACFGEHIHVYHSEVGLPGLRFLHGKVSDLAGLLSPSWLFEGSGKLDAFCLRDRPEAIFLPHKNYRELNRQLREGKCLRGYRRVVEKSSSPLYVRKDLTKRFFQCAKRSQDAFVQ